MSLADARQEALRRLQAIRDGQTVKRHSTQSFAQLLDVWFRQDQAKNKSHDEVERAMRRDILPQLRSRAVDTLATADISDALAKARGGGAPSPHSNRLLSYTKRMFNWAVEQGYLRDNPAKSIKKPAKERSRERFLTPDELRKVWVAVESLDYPFRDFFKLLILTGQRRNEVAAMDWSEIDFQGAMWNLPGTRTKNGRSHQVPLAPGSLEILKKIKDVHFDKFEKPLSGPVLSTREGRPISGFSKAKKRLDKLVVIPEWNIHDLRRTFATLSDEHLVTSHSVIELCLNHVSGTKSGVGAIYNRAEKLDDRRDLMVKWAAFAAGSGAEPEEIDGAGGSAATSN